ncbi:MAG: ABC transporter ATP-binding protein [Methanomicrobiaceae archaeon]|uniref:ABC transporter ATP-binding protein n=1 Tax=Methanoculleus sp. TaxID=90427 RepID=UPI0032104F42|nr:ABC transporter ATP-binding protein [Methanomicrobiaceae archaeon]
MNLVLEIDALSVTFCGKQAVHAVDRVSFSLGGGEILALVGETGCGKSVIAHAVMGLLPREARVSGRIVFKGQDLLALSERERSAMRGKDCAIVFQDPSRALNPVHRIGRQIAEPVLIHGAGSREEAHRRAAALLERMGLSPPGSYLPLYPCQSSGGMNQRFLIAASTILDPSLVIADEPTKGLDPGRVREVEDELVRLTGGGRTALLLITHDLAVARRIADRIAVMYAGEIVELAENDAFFDRPSHPYSRGLLQSLPEHGFVPIPGSSPSPVSPPPGCRFQARCRDGKAVCGGQHPDLVSAADGRMVRCWQCR